MGSSPELCDNSCPLGQVLHNTEVVVATQEAAVRNAGIQSQHVIALLAASAGRGGHFQEAEVVGTPCSPRYMQEEDNLC